MPRYKLTLEYDGAPYAGWQKVGDGQPSVQAAVEAALARLDGGAVEVVGAGRTDAGVHALGQVAHADLRKAFPPWKLREALNAQLRPHPIAPVEVARAADDFHARFHAVRRVYLYRIVNRRPDLALDRGRAWKISPALDASAMAEAAQALIGRHDFSTFRDSQCQASGPVRTLNVARVEADGQDIRLWFEARSFLHRQVRSMVGSLVEVGLGKWRPADLAAALAAADRAQCGPVAPADGLYLARVDYPTEAPSAG